MLKVPDDIQLEINVQVPQEDIEVVPTTFERLAVVHKWPKSEWPIKLIPQLSGKALEAYSRMPVYKYFDRFIE